MPLAGTHRIQRVPEGANRRHTSTVTVAIVKVDTQSTRAVDPAEVDERTYRGSGPGGQHRNTSDTGVALIHRPTGVEAKSDKKRSWWENRQAAWALLEARIAEHGARQVHAARNAARVDQIGLGDRASHDWTWCAWRDEVTHHPTGRKAVMSKALKGRGLL